VEKPAETQHPVHDLLRRRWSPRAFSGRPVEPVAAIALGYPGDPQSLPEKLRQRELAPRERKPLTEFVFAGRWGQISPVVTG
jgi:hypothetical protein